MASYIYVIGASQNRETGPVKIGRSADPARRLRQLQTGQPQMLEIFFEGEVSDEDVSLMERAIHRTVGHKRLKGEWFNMGVDEAVAEIKHAFIMNEDNLRPKTAQQRAQQYRGLI